MQALFTIPLTVHLLVALVPLYNFSSRSFNKIYVYNFTLFVYSKSNLAISIFSYVLYRANVKLVKRTVLDMGITIESTTSNKNTRKCVTTIYNTANGVLTSDISAFVQLFEKIINIFVSNLLLFLCI